MTIFGKRVSEYITFQKGILWLIVIVALGRFALSVAGVPNSTVKWLSVTAVALLGLVYYAIRVHTTGFGSYKQLLPLLAIQSLLANVLVASAIVVAIFTGRDNIYSAPEFSGGSDGKTWFHVGAHLILGVIFTLLSWLVVQPRSMGRRENKLVIVIVRGQNSKKNSKGSPIKRLCQLKNTSPMKLRLLFWQALRVASCDRVGGSDCLSSRKPRTVGSLAEGREAQWV